MGRKDIEAGEQRFVEAFNGGDAAAVARLYAENGRIHPPNADTVQGRAAIEPFIKEFIAMGATVSLSIVELHESPDMCAAIGRYELELHPPGAEPQSDRGKYIEVWARQPDGSWLIADDIFNSSLPVPGS